jgi:hypothetical protein
LLSAHVIDVMLYSTGPFDPYIKAARWFPLAIHPFADLRTVIYSGIEADCKRVRAEAEEDDDNDTDM